MKITSSRSLVAALVASLVTVGALSAQVTYTWNVDAAGNWDNPANWLPNTGFPDGIDDVALFEFNITGNRTITQNVAGLTLGTIVFNDTTPSNNFNISNTNAIRMEVSTGSALIHAMTAGNWHTVGSVILASDIELRADSPSGNSLRVSALTETGGPRNVTKTGLGLVNAGGNWEHTGSTNILAGTLTLGEPANRISATSAINISNATLQMGSVRRANPDRLNNTASVTLSGGVLLHNGDGNGANGTMNAREVIGALTLDGGFNRLQMNFVTGPSSYQQTNEIEAATFARSNRATGIIRGNKLGSSDGGGVGLGATRIFIAGADPVGMVGGGGAAGTTTISILPYLIGGTTTTAADTFITYDNTVITTDIGKDDLGNPGNPTSGKVGFRPLNTSTEFATDLSTSTLNTNVRRTSNQTLASAALANALILTGNTNITANGGLTLQSGALLYSGGAGNTGIIGGTVGQTLDASGRELVAHVVSTNTSGSGSPITLRIDLAIDNADGLTLGEVSLGGTYERRLLLTQINTYTGPTTINSGILEVTSTGTLGDGNVVIRNGVCSGFRTMLRWPTRPRFSWMRVV